jgi:hypothetical protein
MSTENLYFLKISGFLKDEKQKEFHQTVQFIINHLPSECLGHNLALDVNESSLYHLYLLWSSIDALKRFEGSKEFEFLKGAFNTLGTYKDTLSGKKSDLTLFELNHFDTNSSKT